MQELIYSLKVAEKGAGRAELSALLDVAEANLPTRVRISTLYPLSNRGYPADAEAEVMRVMPEGIVLGVSGRQVPKMLVPWQNIAYLSEE
jgi:hypothetical protein